MNKTLLHARESVALDRVVAIHDEAGEVIDITGWIFACGLTRRSGSSDIALAMAASSGDEGFEVVDGPAGKLRIVIDQATLAGVGDTTGNYTLFGELLGTPSGGTAKFITDLRLNVTDEGVDFPGGDYGVSVEGAIALVAAQVQPLVDQATTEADRAGAERILAELARNQAADLVRPENIFVDAALATAEAAIAVGVYFKIVDTASGGTADVYERTAGGSTLLYTETVSGLIGAAGQKVRVVAFALRNRNDNNGWVLITDANHEGLNVSGVSHNSTGINVAYAFAGHKVIAMVVGPDERMARAGMIPGATVGATGAGIWIGAPLKFWIDPLNPTENGIPPWFDPALFVVTGTGATRTIGHPEISSEITPPLIGKGHNSAYPMPDVATSSPQKAGFSVHTLTDLAIQAYFASGSWNVSTNTNGTTPAVNWEAANGGQLRIQHPGISAPNNIDYRLNSYSDAHDVRASVASDQITVRFFDRVTGDQVAAPMSGMGVKFGRAAKCVSATFQACRLNVDRGFARVDPGRLHDGNLPLGNIWGIAVIAV